VCVLQREAENYTLANSKVLITIVYQCDDLLCRFQVSLMTISMMKAQLDVRWTFHKMALTITLGTSSV